MTTYLLERLKSKILETSNVDQDTEPQQFSSIAYENENWHEHFGRVWQFITNFNIVSPYNPAATLSGISLNYLKIISMPNLQTNVYAGLYLLSKKTKATKTFSSE